MKKKNIKIILIIILIGFSQYVTAQNVQINTKEGTNKPQTENQDIDHFSLCIIKGTYEIKKYDQYGTLVLKNENKNDKTIRITGIAWIYEFGELYSPSFGLVKTYKVQIPKFFGFCFNHQVFGLGNGFVSFD